MAGPSVRDRMTAATANRVLDSLPTAELGRVVDRAELIQLGVAEVVDSPGKPIPYAYFPLDCVLAIGITDGPAGVEVLTTGNEGLVGLSAWLDAPLDDQSAICRVPGRCLRLPVAALPGLLTDCPVLEQRVRRFGPALVSSALQRVLCLRQHRTDACCAAWLLLMSDRVGGPSFALTQGTLAELLGVRRATVSASAAALREAGLIRYARGRVTIVDRAGLEAAACSCYRAADRIFAAVVA